MSYNLMKKSGRDEFIKNACKDNNNLHFLLYNHIKSNETIINMINDKK